MSDQVVTKTTVNRFQQVYRRAAIGLSGLILICGVITAVQLGADFFSTPDRRGQRQIAKGNYDAAAKEFNDPFQRAAAFYRAGDFKQAASIYGGLPGEIAAFNQANALVMLGEYQKAVGQYDRALESRSNWEAAKTNREIAVGRAERLKSEGGNMTSGKLSANEIIFSNKKSEGGEGEEIKTEEMSDEELRGMWLRQVQTTPKDFLRSKFAYQQAVKESSSEVADE